MHNTSHVAKRRAALPLPLPRLASGPVTGGGHPLSLLRPRPRTLANKPSLAIFYILHPRPQPSTVVGALPRESCGTIVCEMASHCSPFIFRPLVTLPSFIECSPFNHTTHSAESARHG
jgi:hypothetical protein